MLKPTIFREYDIRGIAETELQDSGIQDLGRAVGTYLQRHNGKNINLGRDCRLSSERLRNALMAGLKSSGCHVTDIGVVPTPDALNVDGLGLGRGDLERLLTVDRDEWAAEVPEMRAFFDRFGDRLPPELSRALESLSRQVVTARV